MYVHGDMCTCILATQEGEPLHIVDVYSGAVATASSTEFVTPSAFIFLYASSGTLERACTWSCCCAYATCRMRHARAPRADDAKQYLLLSSGWLAPTGLTTTITKIPDGPGRTTRM